MDVLLSVITTGRHPPAAPWSGGCCRCRCPGPTRRCRCSNAARRGGGFCAPTGVTPNPMDGGRAFFRLGVTTLHRHPWPLKPIGPAGRGLAGLLFAHHNRMIKMKWDGMDENETGQKQTCSETQSEALKCGSGKSLDAREGGIVHPDICPLPPPGREEKNLAGRHRRTRSRAGLRAGGGPTGGGEGWGE